MLDVRLYRIKPGRRGEFHALARDETLPLARSHGHQVVVYGPSTHDEDAYYLIRAFSDDEQRHAALADLYESEEWLRDYDERVMSLIESYQTAVFPTSAEAVEVLQKAVAPRDRPG